MYILDPCQKSRRLLPSSFSLKNNLLEFCVDVELVYCYGNTIALSQLYSLNEMKLKWQNICFEKHFHLEALILFLLWKYQFNKRCAVTDFII